MKIRVRITYLFQTLNMDLFKKKDEKESYLVKFYLNRKKLRLIKKKEIKITRMIVR